MPHCIIEGARSLECLITAEELLALVNDTAMASALFKVGEVKVRLNLYEHFSVGGTQDDFVHVIFYLLAGRSDAQKKALSAAIVRALAERLPTVESISLDVRDMRREAFSNRRNCQL